MWIAGRRVSTLCQNDICSAEQHPLCGGSKSSAAYSFGLADSGPAAVAPLGAKSPLGSSSDGSSAPLSDIERGRPPRPSAGPKSGEGGGPAASPLTSSVAERARPPPLGSEARRAPNVDDDAAADDSGTSYIAPRPGLSPSPTASSLERVRARLRERRGATR